MEDLVGLESSVAQKDAEVQAGVEDQFLLKEGGAEVLAAAGTSAQV